MATAVQLPILVAQPSHRYRVTLSGVEYVLRLTYRDRTSSWYLDLYDVDGNALALGRRLSTRFSPLLGVVVDRGPPGLLYVEGTEPYGLDGVALYYVTDVTPTASVVSVSATVDS